MSIRGSFIGALVVFGLAFFILQRVIPPEAQFFPGLVPMLSMIAANIAWPLLEAKKPCPNCSKPLPKVGATPKTLMAYISDRRTCSHCKAKVDRRGEKVLTPKTL